MKGNEKIIGLVILGLITVGGMFAGLQTDVIKASICGTPAPVVVPVVGGVGATGVTGITGVAGVTAPAGK